MQMIWLSAKLGIENKTIYIFSQAFNRNCILKNNKGEIIPNNRCMPEIFGGKVEVN